MKKTLTFILASLCLISCKKSANENQTSANQLPAGRIKAEEMFPGKTGEVQTGNYYGQTLEYQVINGMKIFQGDIVLTDQAATSKLTTNSADRPRTSTYLWPNATVYYTIDPSVTGSNLTIVNSAITYWAQNTIIHMVPRTTQTDYVTFVYNLSGPASSGIGRVGGQQFIYVAGTAGNMIHEIGHTVGLWHEHCRSDRDTYVTVVYANMSTDPAVTMNFQTYSQAGQAGIDYYGGLDFGSIMMYDSYQFTINGLPTLTKKNGSTFTAQRTALSATDIAAVKFIYTPPPIVTFNVSSTNSSQTTTYAMSYAGINLASGRTVGQGMTNTIQDSFDPYSATLSPYTQIPPNSSGTIIMTILGGYHPVNAFLNPGNGSVSGVISGNTITFNGVFLPTAPRTVNISLQ